MQVRIVGAADLIERLAIMARLAKADAAVYPSRRGGDLRLYVTLDDRVVSLFIETAIARMVEHDGR